jgi:transcriptional regulator with XRE-family HTH domain
MSSTSLIIKEFGQKLRTLRCSRHLTLKQLAAALGYAAHGYLSELEAGKKTPSVEFTVIASRFFGVTTDQLLKDEIDLPASLVQGEAEQS